MTTPELDIFLACAPGLEEVLADEARTAGFALPETTAGGVTTRGGLADVWRANLTLRGAGRVLVRIAEFRAFHLAQLDKRAHKVAWGDVLRPDVPFRVEAVCRKSKIYHNGAAAQRVATAITETLGAPEDREGKSAETVTVMVRIDDNLVTVSVDSSGAGLHKRGHKEAVGKAPLRETMAALFLRQCGYDGSEPVVDPMCGSGTFPIEAAEIAMGLAPGRARGFAFEHLAGFDAEGWAAMKAAVPGHATELRFHGFDRDAGAVRMATANAARAGVDGVCNFTCQPVSALERPEGSPGIVMINPPYGGRIGNRKLLFGLYGSLGTVLKERFAGWRVGLVTNDGGLAKASGLPFLPPGPPVAHGGLTVKLWRTEAL